MADDEEIVEVNEFIEEAEDHEVEIMKGDEDPDVYTPEGREELLEGDEIAPWEEAFSEGDEEGEEPDSK